MLKKIFVCLTMYFEVKNIYIFSPSRQIEVKQKATHFLEVHQLTPKTEKTFSSLLSSTHKRKIQNSNFLSFSQPPLQAVGRGFCHCAGMTLDGSECGLQIRRGIETQWFDSTFPAFFSVFHLVKSQMQTVACVSIVLLICEV